MAKILLIEDEDQVRTLLRIVLESAGHAVIEATNGEDGLRRYAEDPADVVITDLIMPQKEGLETITELRRREPTVRIIAISGGSRGSAPDNYLKMARHFGADLVLAKPFSNRQFLKAVSSILETEPSAGDPPLSLE